jgi:hypothetical protein
MLESMNDYISLGVLAMLIFGGFRLLFLISNARHAEKVKRHEEEYYSLLEGMSEEEGNDDTEGPYYE